MVFKKNFKKRNQEIFFKQHFVGTRRKYDIARLTTQIVNFVVFIIGISDSKISFVFFLKELFVVVAFMWKKPFKMKKAKFVQFPLCRLFQVTGAEDLPVVITSQVTSLPSTTQQNLT